MATFGFNRTALCATQPKLHPVFEDRIISHRADVVWPTSELRFKTVVLLFGGFAVKGKCNATKSETIDGLKDNIREAIGEHNR